MKRYLLFSGVTYYPSGGIDDMVGNFQTLEIIYDLICKVNQVYQGTSHDWFQILDTQTGADLEGSYTELSEVTADMWRRMLVANEE